MDFGSDFVLASKNLTHEEFDEKELLVESNFNTRFNENDDGETCLMYVKKIKFVFFLNSCFLFRYFYVCHSFIHVSFHSCSFLKQLIYNNFLFTMFVYVFFFFSIHSISFQTIQM